MKPIKYLIKVLGRLFKISVRKVESLRRNNMLDKNGKKKAYNIPELRTYFHQDPEVIILCYYLKTLGVSQSLNAGDIYYTRNEQGMPKAFVYTKNEVDGYGDFDFLTSGNYFRMVSQQEAMVLIKFCGYEPDPMNAILMDDSGGTRLAFHSPTLNTNIAIEAGNVQAAYLKAAYLIGANNKMLAEANDKIDEDQFFKNTNFIGNK